MSTAADDDVFQLDIYGEGYDHDHEVGDANSNPETTNFNHAEQQAYGRAGNSQSGGSQEAGAPNATSFQGTKRKDMADDRPTDPGATSALFITDLPWWITDDDIRGWANQSGCEDELDEVTFSEHKVNGKSKGQAYVLFSTPQAATATKHLMEDFGETERYKQKFSSNYTNPLVNPFKTLPKDGNTRNSSQSNRTATGGFNNTGNQGQSVPGQGGFRGGRGGFHNRGGLGGYNRGGFQQQMPGSYQGGAINNFQGGMQYNGGFRGGMMGGARGANLGARGRGSGFNNFMSSMPMPFSAPMPNMNVGIGGPGFQGTFFNQPNDNWNPHGAKRTRQE